MNRLPYFVTGLARCGHHAIIAWLCKQHRETILFHNNVNGKLKHRNTTKYGDGKPKRHLYSLENFDLRGFQELFGEQPMKQFILVVRDPLNWIASSLKNDDKVLAKLTETWEPRVGYYERWFCASMSRLNMYKQQMKQIIGKHNLIGRDYIVVKYNNWFYDKNYRREITRKLNIPFSDDGINSVPKYGGGSSFDRFKRDGEAQRMEVLNRWKHYEDSDRFWDLIDNELIEYSEKVFGFNPLRRK